ncbi:MAG: polyprenyl synthetase family protein [Parvularculales bacterium]
MDAVIAPSKTDTPLSAAKDSSKAIAILQSLTARDMEQVNTLIVERITSQAALVPKLTGYTFDSGGKRLRPMLTIAAAHIGNPEAGNHISLATAVEFMHTATLLHDDVVDDSHLRRGQPTARVIWDNRSSILVGDFLLGRAFELMVEAGSLEALGVLSQAAAVIAEGEVMQLSAAKEVNTTEETYLQVIDAKTATLFAAATQTGAIIAGLEKDVEIALKNYGRNLGMVFQLVDDALDYGGTAITTGKLQGNDFQEGKITLPVILAMAAGDEKEHGFWRRTLGENQIIRDGDFERAREILERHKSLSGTLACAQYYGAQAQSALNAVPKSVWRKTLMELVDFCIHRTH